MSVPAAAAAPPKKPPPNSVVTHKPAKVVAYAHKTCANWTDLLNLDKKKLKTIRSTLKKGEGKLLPSRSRF